MKSFIYIFCLIVSQLSYAETVNYELKIAETILSPAGEKIKTLTINGGIPGPVLKFKVGDVAHIKVQNNLDNEETSIHWHGLLLPNEQDGVPYLTTPPIKPGKSHMFEFKLTHAGTYWYHSHTGLQEQRGIYGSIVVEDPDDSIKVDREHVLILSDWTNEKPSEVMRTLMSGNEWYSLKKGNMQSIYGAMKAGELGEYFSREWSRMPPMDISDVAYDTFLINGKRQSKLIGKPGEKIRLRIINAAASSYFYLTSGMGSMTIVAADGPSVEPVDVERILIGIAETYDVVITIPQQGAVEFKASAQDGTGHASVIFGEGKLHKAPTPPRANLYNMDQVLINALNFEDSQDDLERPMAPYKKLKAKKSTKLNPKLPVRKITLRLNGDMRRYIWSFDGKTLAEDSMIKVSKGEVLQIEMINDTMMHHPIHLHGHFFRLLNGQGNFSPLKHTVDVHPMGKRTIEFEANEEKDWFFHCHLLYHMDAGMARVVSYKEQGEDHKPNLDPALLNPWYVMANGSVQSHMSEGRLKFMKGRNDFNIMWDVGYEGEYEVDLTWGRYFNQNFSTVLGYRLSNEGTENRAIAGFNYWLPLFFQSSVTVDSEGDLRFGLNKEFQLTDRMSLFTELEYDTNTEWEWSIGSEYTLSKKWSLIMQYQSDRGIGAGLSFRF